MRGGCRCRGSPPSLLLFSCILAFVLDLVSFGSYRIGLVYPPFLLPTTTAVSVATTHSTTHTLSLINLAPVFLLFLYRFYRLTTSLISFLPPYIYLISLMIWNGWLPTPQQHPPSSYLHRIFGTSTFLPSFFFLRLCFYSAPSPHFF
ncbi:hypothetical protein BDN72DRAFT_84417 [Pluteus cervinus]|uniref:Uncharacterized protein n=1 Tax=Pluteus cervinus TaxID=181527 RepID=A0ACD3APW7_9AGAR|nr:hypothetical protein BDN72DRAFT_84417 [Pluteus cervinus]